MRFRVDDPLPALHEADALARQHHEREHGRRAQQYEVQDEAEPYPQLARNIPYREYLYDRELERPDGAWQPRQ